MAKAKAKIPDAVQRALAAGYIPLDHKPKSLGAQRLLSFIERCRLQGWTVERVGIWLGCDASTLWRYLAEKRKIPPLLSRVVEAVIAITPTTIRMKT